MLSSFGNAVTSLKTEPDADPSKTVQVHHYKVTTDVKIEALNEDLHEQSGASEEQIQAVDDFTSINIKDDLFKVESEGVEIRSKDSNTVLMKVLLQPIFIGTCDHCKLTFHSKQELRIHLLGHDLGRTANVVKGDTDISLMKDTHLEVDIHSDTTKVLKYPMVLLQPIFIGTCDYCEQQFNSKQVLQKHLLGHRLGRAANIDKGDTEMSLMKHTHLEVDISSDTTKLLNCPMVTLQPIFVGTCDYCEQLFNSKQTLQEHLLGHDFETAANFAEGDTEIGLIKDTHLEVGISSDANKLLNGPLVRIQPIFLGTCDYCEKSFNSKPALQKHLVEHDLERAADFAEDVTEPVIRRYLEPYQKIHTKRNNKVKSVQTEKKLFQCDICVKEFYNKNKHKVHMRIHTREQLLKCTFCDKLFNHKRNLNEHIRTHTGVKPFKCDVCKQQFGTKSYLKIHFRVHSGEKPFKCDLCEKYFRTKDALKVHLRIHTGEKPYQCDVCKKKFVIKCHLKVHMSIHTGEKRYECDVCKKQFYHKSSFNEHISRHTGVKPFKCNVCEQQFITKKYLKIHLRIHSGEKPFKCDVCEKQFRFKGSLNHHLRRVHLNENKQFQCDICKKQFALKIHLKVHMSRHLSIHTREKPYKCDVCKKRFNHKHILNEHIRTHTGVKPFKCSVCEQQFSTKRYLSSHCRIHSEKKPFKCDVCEKQFRTKSCLNVHLCIHTGRKPFQCDVCKKQFILKRHLRMHMSVHTGEKIYKCDVCKKTISSKRWFESTHESSRFT